MQLIEVPYHEGDRMLHRLVEPASLQGESRDCLLAYLANVAHHRQEKASDAPLSTVQCMRGLAGIVTQMLGFDVIWYCGSVLLSIGSLSPVRACDCKEGPGEKVGLKYSAALDHQYVQVK